MTEVHEETAASVYGKGQAVAVTYTDGYVYQGIVIKTQGSRVQVRWMPKDGGTAEWVTAASVAPLAARAELTALVVWIQKAKTAYYNTQVELVPDAEYDEWEKRVRALNPKHPILDATGAEPEKRARNKVALPVGMPSLDKVKPDSVQAWLDNHPGPWVLEDKIDGISLQIECGPKPRLFTRGNGTIGQDISHLIPHLRLPDLTKIRGRVRAEVVMSRARWTQWAAQAENARALVAGSINTLTGVHAAFPHIDVLAYEIMQPRMKPSDSLRQLRTWGFKVVPHKIVTTITVPQLQALRLARRTGSPYDVDGIVIVQDKVSQLATTSKPAYAVAFKDTDEGDVAETTVVSVEWNASRHGYLIPTVIIEPTRLSGVTVKRATGFNAAYIRDNRIGPGARITITRSGDVIPDIQAVIVPARRASMPAQVAEWNGAHLVLKDAAADSDVAVRRIAYFFGYIGVEGLKGGVASQLSAAGHDTILKVANLTLKQMEAAIGVAAAAKIHPAIRYCLSECTIMDIMVASGEFGRGISATRLKTVARSVPSLRDLLNQPPAQISAKIAAMPGWSSATATQFAAGVPAFLRFLVRLPAQPKPEKKPPTAGRLKGVRVCFTGFRDAALEAQIENSGGTVTNTVNAQLTVLIARDSASTKPKAVKARQLGITIMGPDQFRRAYRL